MNVSSRSFPSRVAELGFTVTLPTDWLAHDLPTEDVDLSNPTAFATLGIVSAPHAVIVLAVAARPAYDDGTLLDWARYHLDHNGLKPRAMGPHTVAGVAAVVGEAEQASELGAMVVRFAFFEDGGRLLNLSFTAPELLADAVREVWFTALRTFVLETPRGSRFSVPAEIDRVSQTVADATGHSPPLEDGMSPHDSTVHPQDSEVPVVPSRLPQFADFALATDTASLDPDAPINVDLRNRGIGLVPNMVAVREAPRYASVASGAIMAQFDVPFGWHVIDDGKRALVFEPSGRIQISLNLLPREGRSNARILDALEAEARSSYAEPQFVRMREGRIHALGVRGISDGDQPLEQCHMLYPFRDQSMLLRARVTATPETVTNACNLAELILESCAFDAFQIRDDAPAPSDARDGPTWWHEALAMEENDRPEAAEHHIHAHCAHIGYAQATAEMYRRRMLRLKSIGDEAGALHAFTKASGYIAMYASMATSGSEGHALSVERDRFRAQLVADFGGDPEAST